MIPDKVGSEPAAHAEEEGTEREILQVPEDGIHKAAKNIQILTMTAPFQLPLLWQITPEERISVSCYHYFHKISSQAELESECPMIKELPWGNSSTEIFWLYMH